MSTQPPPAAAPAGSDRLYKKYVYGPKISSGGRLTWFCYGDKLSSGGRHTWNPGAQLSTSSLTAAGSSWNMLSVTTTKTWFAMIQARSDSLAKFATSSVHLLDAITKTASFKKTLYTSRPVGECPRSIKQAGA